jgi:hypothetical protein
VKSSPQFVEALVDREREVFADEADRERAEIVVRGAAVSVVAARSQGASASTESVRASLQGLERLPELADGADPISAGRCLAVELTGADALKRGAPRAAVSVGLYEDGQLVGAAVSNVATLELFYAVGGTARLIQPGLLGEPGASAALPLAGERGDAILLQLDAALTDRVSTFMRAWADRRLQLVTAVEGSRALAIAEAAKGRVAFAGASDAAGRADDAAAFVLRAAGGDVDAKSGIEAVALHPDTRARIIDLSRESETGGQP